ncbi:MAG: T9SS type A sorting domain-containing protein [Bacteroidetes bacterium]|nr:T9SS type A sorting domain-containing protein [Bacteroidota bacterium]
MKKGLLLMVLFFVAGKSFSQLLTTNVNFPTDATTALEITLDATKGNKGLLNNAAGDVYIHTGVITDSSKFPTDWRYVKFGNLPNIFTQAWGPLRATSLGNNRWKITIGSATSSLRQYYGVPANEKITRLAILFRSGNGSKKHTNIDGSDMYIQIYQSGEFAAKFTSPAMQPMYFPTPEPLNPVIPVTIPVTVVTSQNATLNLTYTNSGNTTSIGNANNATTVSGNALINTECRHSIAYQATAGNNTLRDTVNLFIYPKANPTGARPAGKQDGITYENGNTEALLILHAPLKNKVAVIGDFNQWTPTCESLMKKDGEYFWTRVTGLTPGQKYVFQYVVDDTLKITDPYSELVLDPWNDQYIPKSNFPNMPPYPAGRTSGMASVLVPGEPAYNWKTPVNYGRPDKRDLMVYELLVRDFVATRSYRSIIDSLGYFQKLGFNAIQLMPVNEFDGNESWGYNPNHFLALDKAYGTKNDLKELIDKAHERGIAIILDVAFNHATGSSPLAAMWWNRATNKTAANNPYFYVDAQHPASVFHDMNHNYPKTREHVKRFIDYWLKEYRVDGFRWDLSKGFTNQNCGFTDFGCWNKYNQDRINILQDYKNQMEASSPGSYCILEHLGDWDEEAELAKREMMLWGEMHEVFKQNSIGFPNSNGSLSNVHWKNRQFWQDPYLNDRPHLITYAVSHDKERIMVENLRFGNQSQANHNVRDQSVALRRSEAVGGFLLSFPGPKMIWQFDELGFDFSLNSCPPNWRLDSLSDGCRTSNKPVRWDYYAFGPRMRIFETYAAMAKLRNQFKFAFRSPNLEGGTNLDGNVKTIVVKHPDLSYVAVANFDVVQQNPTVTFPAQGTWYDYTNGGSINVSGGSSSVNLAPGQFRIFINQNVTGGVVTSVSESFLRNKGFSMNVYPNPVGAQSMIRYELPQSGRVQLQLLNIQGQVMGQRNLGFQAKGVQTVELNALQLAGKQLPSGQYLLKLQLEKEAITQKVIIP